jgi:hypothetical protein
MEDNTLVEKEKALLTAKKALLTAYNDYLNAFINKWNTTYLKYNSTDIIPSSLYLNRVISSTKSFTDNRVGPDMMDKSMKAIREKYPSGSMISSTISTKVDALQKAYNGWKLAVKPFYDENTERLVKAANEKDQALAASVQEPAQGGRRTRRSRRRNTKSRKSKRRRTNRRR